MILCMCRLRLLDIFRSGAARPSLFALAAVSVRADVRRSDPIGIISVFFVLGQPVKYTYIATMDETSEAPLFTGVAKVDLQAASGADALAGRITYPPHCNGGEVQFIPSGGARPSWHTFTRECARIRVRSSAPAWHHLLCCTRR